MAEHLGQFADFHTALQRESGIGVPQVHKSDVIETSLFRNTLMKQSHHVGRIGFQRAGMRKHIRPAGVLGVLLLQ